LEILDFNKKTKEIVLFIFNRSWSWRDSNPRPNRQQNCFLHA